MAQVKKQYKLTEDDIQKMQSPEELLVLINLLRYVNTETYVEAETEEFLGRCGISYTSLKRNIKILKEQSYVEEVEIGEDSIQCRMNISLKQYINGIIPNMQPKEVKAADPSEIAFADRMKQVYPRVSKMQKPLTLGKYNYIRIKLLYTNEEILATLADMENYTNIYKYIDTQLTLINWLKKRYGART